MTHNLVEVAVNSFVAGVRSIHTGEFHYMSCSITGGPLMLAAAIAGGYKDIREFKSDPKNAALFESIRKENVAIARDNHARWLIRNPGKFLINPTAVDFPVFTQADYGVFWRRVIEELRPTIVISNGWEESDGSKNEILDAIFYGCNLELINGKRIDSNYIHSRIGATKVGV